MAWRVRKDNKVAEIIERMETLKLWEAEGYHRVDEPAFILPVEKEIPKPKQVKKISVDTLEPVKVPRKRAPAKKRAPVKKVARKRATKN